MGLSTEQGGKSPGEILVKYQKQAPEKGLNTFALKNSILFCEFCETGILMNGIFIFTDLSGLHWNTC